ncbi:MAG: isoleucine--tRNA ligase [Acidobacteria bacterium]|nr:MAG: isoleucine--tRNA ligase [Acidobacteriota bacterium]
MTLKNTINLPKTDFQMKANLPHMEPRMLERWDNMDLYHRIRKARAGRAAFVLHDGPPYANGHIHLGHTLNKILKDLIVKSKAMEGFDTPYVPGWDCHGLPIEIKVAGKKKANPDVLKIRQECREYADRFVGIQRDEFRRLGVFGEWEHPYLTMSPEYEATTARLLGRFIEQNGVFKGMRPVHWCISCETALAEAEVEYKDHTSESIYVKFPIAGGPPEVLPQTNLPLFVLIWTTTPWTLPANLAVAFHPDYDYCFVEAGGEVYLLARHLVEEVARQCRLADYRVLSTVGGGDLKDLKVLHPWIDRESKVVYAEHVTLEQGTGIVHTAPGHGMEDYLTGREYGLEIYNPVDNSGRFVDEIEHFAGMQVFEANPRINEFLKSKGRLLCQTELVHSYPHCWRCHNPVIFRATPQWFIGMELNGLRQKSLDAIKQVQWKPVWGEDRITNMIANRPDWCISRQRLWGVPITIFYCRSCRKPLIDAKVVDFVADIFERETADAWYRRPASELMPPGTTCKCGGTEFEKEFDILDVWFDSGSSHYVVLNGEDKLSWPADIYLEGGDQYRGWFHSSLLIAVGVKGTAPYRTVICHGWTLDAEGRAMSKSVGNVISPLDLIKDNGAEILRLWVASIDYTEDARISEEILSRLREAYRKLRNTSRFLLGNLYDFNPAADTVADSCLSVLDRWALARTAVVAKKVEEAYKRYEFHTVYHTLYNFFVVDMSSFYLDILKDRLYTAAAQSASRRAAQTALFRIADTMVRLLAPVLPFTAEEIWMNLYKDGAPADSVHMAEFSRETDTYLDLELLARWERFQEIRERVSKVLEECRQTKVIGNSLEARTEIRCGEKMYEYLASFGTELRFLFLVSEVVLVRDPGLVPDELDVKVTTAAGQKCERCWHYTTDVSSFADFPTICGRCHGALEEMGLTG